MSLIPFLDTYLAGPPLHEGAFEVDWSLARQIDVPGVWALTGDLRYWPDETDEVETRTSDGSASAATIDGWWVPEGRMIDVPFALDAVSAPAHDIASQICDDDGHLRDDLSDIWGGIVVIENIDVSLKRRGAHETLLSDLTQMLPAVGAVAVEPDMVQHHPEDKPHQDIHTWKRMGFERVTRAKNRPGVYTATGDAIFMALKPDQRA